MSSEVPVCVRGTRLTIDEENAQHRGCHDLEEAGVGCHIQPQAVDGGLDAGELTGGD